MQIDEWWIGIKSVLGIKKEKNLKLFNVNQNSTSLWKKKEEQTSAYFDCFSFSFAWECNAENKS
jgi:hypothetical protein